MSITYQIFGRYGWIRHGIPLAIRAFVFRMRHGFDFRDCWSLDTAMAKWLAPRLRYMSEIAHGAPWGYPNEVEFAGSDPDEVETDFEAWKVDLLAASKALAAYASVYDDDLDYDSERRVFDAGKDAMKWVAKNFPSLWD